MAVVQHFSGEIGKFTAFWRRVSSRCCVRKTILKMVEFSLELCKKMKVRRGGVIFEMRDACVGPRKRENRRRHLTEWPR